MKAGVNSQGVLVRRQCPTLEVWMRTVQIQWGKEEGRRAVGDHGEEQRKRVVMPRQVVSKLLFLTQWHEKPSIITPPKHQWFSPTAC